MAAQFSVKMGPLMSVRIKPNFMGLFRVLNNMNWFIVFFSLINLSMCIYEDQIGKFDWRQTYVGKIKFAQFDTVSTAKKIIVATEENVLAALHLKTGQVVWRHVFESASTGSIQLLHVSENTVTVTGSNPYLVRGWDSGNGVLLWEWSLNILDNDKAQFSEWWVQQNMLVHMMPVFGSHIEVTMYNLLTGQNKSYSSKLPAPWINDGCILSAPYYTCITGDVGSQLLMSLDVTSNAVQIISKPLSNYVNSGGQLSPFDGTTTPGFILNKKMMIIKENDFVPLNVELKDSIASVAIIDSLNEPIVLQVWSSEARGFSQTAHNFNGAEIIDFQHNNQSNHIPGVEIFAVACSKSNKESHACRVLVSSDDDAMHLMQQGGRILWSREEALANIVAVEFVDLPISDLDAAIESEFDQKEGSVWTAFTRRLHMQWQQLRNLLQSLQQTGANEDGANEPLVRDYFNLHKIIVVLTDVGKIFGMDNLSGNILWSFYEPTLSAERAVMLQRQTYITVVARHQDTGNGLIISFDPHHGTLVGERRIELDTQIVQCTTLPYGDQQRLRALIVMDEQENIQVFPASASSLVRDMYMYVANRDTAVVKGYALRFDGREVQAEKTWSLNLGGSPNSGHRLVLALGKSPQERVHSPGRVLGDRSVLYKYSDPNLVLFITEGPDAIHKDVVTATCVDAVSGAVAAAQVHRRARARPLALHSDNFIAYAYYSDKNRRTEIATMELYEGKARWLAPGEAFSSFASRVSPLVERQAYILPGGVTALGVTVTERGLADRHALLALSSGALLELPWAYLEPRRPVAPTPEQREEGLLPYTPELPLPAEATLNYNQTLQRVSRIHTAISGLESTSLVLATGLDIFYTRVAPSKTFDLLKDDFDYYIIALVLAGLIIASYSSKYFASKKTLKIAWS